MGRGRVVHHRHALHHTETVNPGSQYAFEKGYSYCDPKGTKVIEGTRFNNYRNSMGVHASADQTPDDLMRTNCPACSQKWGKEKLEALGGRVRHEKLEIGSRFKSLFKVWVDDVVRCYIAIDAGWGGKWQVHKLGIPYGRSALNFNDDHGDGMVGSVIGVEDPQDYLGTKSKDGAPIRPIHRSSLNALLSVVPELVDGGFLPTREEQKAAAAAKDAERAAQDARWDRERAERAEQRDLARDALKAVTERADKLGLSNSETMGLLAALKLL